MLTPSAAILLAKPGTNADDESSSKARGAQDGIGFSPENIASRRFQAPGHLRFAVCNLGDNSRHDVLFDSAIILAAADDRAH